mgnify:CR=1 FL=1
MSDVEIGRSKRARAAYSFDDVSLVPSRRTRDDALVSLDWKIDAYSFNHPIIAAPMDSVVSPSSAKTFAAAGGLAILNLEGVWTRYEDPTGVLNDIAALDSKGATAKLQEIYAKPIKPELIAARIQEMRASGITVAGALSPQRTAQFAKQVVDAGVDLGGVKAALCQHGAGAGVGDFVAVCGGECHFHGLGAQGHGLVGGCAVEAGRHGGSACPGDKNQHIVGHSALDGGAGAKAQLSQIIWRAACTKAD